ILLDWLIELHWIHKLCGSKLLCPLLLAIICINGNDPASTLLNSALDDTESYTTATKDGDRGTLLDGSSDDSGTIAGGDTPAEKTGRLHGGIGTDGVDRDVCNDGLLREGRGTHEVEERRALAGQTGCSLRHDTNALGCTDLAAE